MTTTPIIEGALYLYASDRPAGCKGMRYRIVKADVVALPSYQHQVLVEALEGPEKGVWIVCSLHNFTTRYDLLAERNGEA